MKNPKSKGFTLVELAIVITIIGLLIGGVLKGQELLQNARMTSALAQMKGFSAASMTFKDVYKAWPGDMQNPGNFIANCTASPCNISGDGDGSIGPNGMFASENNNYWLHLGKAGLITGIDPNSTWTSGTLYTASYPDFKMGGKLMLLTTTQPTTHPYFPEGLQGTYFYATVPVADGTSYEVVQDIPVSQFAKFDLKADNGKPWTGLFILTGPCGETVGNDKYHADNKTPCRYYMKSDF